MAMSEFGLSMVMLILLDHYMFIEVIRYLHDNNGLEANKMHYDPLLCLQTKPIGPTIGITLCYTILSFMT